MTTVFLDFETAIDSKNGLTLRKQCTTEYIYDSRFKVFGCGVQIDNGPRFWVSEKQLRERFREIDWADSTVVAHNASFDLAILHWKYSILPKQMVCTKSMARAVYGATLPSFSLKNLALKLGFPEKGEMETDGLFELTSEQEKGLAEYCLRDVEICARLYNELKDKIPACEWPVIDWTIRAFVDPKLKLNRTLAKQIEQEVSEKQKKIIEASGIDKATLSSNKKFPEFLKSLGYDVPLKKKANKKGVHTPALSRSDKEFVEFYENGDERLKALLDARITAKQTNERTRAANLSDLPIDLYPVDIQYSGALQTHRMSGGDGGGGNFQNMKNDSEIKRCIEAPEGYWLIEADFSRIEPRILGVASRDPRLIRDINSQSPYTGFASEIYGREVTKADVAEYKVGKEGILGLGYNMGAERFVQTVKTKAKLIISKEDAWNVVSLYRSKYPYVPLFWKTCQMVIGMMAKGQQAVFPTFPLLKVKKEAIILPSGLELKYPGLKKTYGLRGREEWTQTKFVRKLQTASDVKIYGGLLTENICQALAGEVCKEAIRRLLPSKFPVVGQVHDSVLVLCKDEDLDEAKETVIKAMTDQIPWWKQIQLGCELKIGRNWKECH